MIHFITRSLLLSLCCLLSLLGTAQPINPLPSRAVQLVPGDVIRERMVGLDSVTYQAARTYVAQARPLVAAADTYQADLRRQLHLKDSLAIRLSNELRRCQLQAAAADAEFSALSGAARAALAQPALPLLLDPHFYQGSLAGAVGLVLLKLFVFH